MSENCVHCGTLVMEITVPFNRKALIHKENHDQLCPDGSGHIACTVQIGIE